YVLQPEFDSWSSCEWSVCIRVVHHEKVKYGWVYGRLAVGTVATAQQLLPDQVFGSAIRFCVALKIVDTPCSRLEYMLLHVRQAVPYCFAFRLNRLFLRQFFSQ